MDDACARFITSSNRPIPTEGHLSLEYGFLPPRPTQERFPVSHSAWDEAALSLPRLFFSNRAQEALASLPLLSASEEALPEEYLMRASVVLSALAHAYWRFGVTRFYAPRITQVPTELPAVLLEPWVTVSRRLNRNEPSRPFQSFYDLFLANYRIRADATSAAPLVENIDVLVPTFDSETERVFYGAFIEMHYHFTPVIGAIVSLEAALQAEDTPQVCRQLHVMAESFARATQTWAKIGPREDKPLYCDPVIWSKTVAILGVPPAMCPQGGTSGACAPIIYVMDALLSRERYDSYYGQYVANDASPMVPLVVARFAERVRALPLQSYREARADSTEGGELERSINDLVRAYTGRRGWLGRHASKAFSYLCISTLTGRNASVSGHERYFSRQTWERAADNLNDARSERQSDPVDPARSLVATSGAAIRAGTNGGSRCPFSEQWGRQAPADDDGRETRPSYDWIEVARHHHEDDLWVVIDSVVYDLTRYLRKHPGGRYIMLTYAGQDATSVFESQNAHDLPLVAKMLPGLAIGRVPAAPFEPMPGWRDWLYRLLRARQATHIQYAHPMGHDFAMALFSKEHGHQQLWQEFLSVAVAQLDDELWARLSTTATARFVLERVQLMSTSYDYSGSLPSHVARLAQQRCRDLEAVDTVMLDDLLQSTLAVFGEAREHGSAERARADLLAAVQPRLLRYFCDMAQRIEALESTVAQVPAFARYAATA